MKVSRITDPLAIVGCWVPRAAGRRDPTSCGLLLRRGEDVVGPSPDRGWGDVLRFRPLRQGQIGEPIRLVSRRRRRGRLALLRDFSARGPQHRSPAPPAAGGGVGGPRRRGHARLTRRGQPRRSLRRHDDQRLRASLREGPRTPSTGTPRRTTRSRMPPIGSPSTSIFAVRALPSTRTAAGRSSRFIRPAGASRAERRTGRSPEASA